MDLPGLGKNRVFIIALVILAIAGYVTMRMSRDRLNRNLEKHRPPFLTMEFAESRRAEADEADMANAQQLLTDAEVYISNRHYQEAGSALHRAIALYPDGLAYFRYGQYLILMNQTTWAGETLQLAGELGYPQELVLFERARLHAKMKEPAEAMEFLRQAVEAGYDDDERIRQDEIFDSIRGWIDIQ